ncbi:siderophore-interacting protein [Bradyrhizobium sp. NAS80.1]|uniref:siderophore-interacting protein n=1 Tax=Bradyrhizobium sp. NAS80.1 TaxID=1680159 RepID=UPI00116133A8|nr:siderophore-interacting protein [Bradyrhizobium sp. NAS80.1]
MANNLSKDRFLRTVEVTQVIDLTPRMRRIVVSGESLRTFETDRPGQWVKVFVPVPGRAEPEGRPYTIRRFDRSNARLEIDFVRHGDGPLATWAEQAQVGMHAQLGAPQSQFRVSDDAPRLVLAGDETALPAILAILESRPKLPRIEALLEVQDSREEQATPDLPDLVVNWIHRGETGQPGLELERRIRSLDWSCWLGQIFLAAEGNVVRRLRTFLTSGCGISRAAMHTSGYWKLGTPSERESDSDY